jgi:NADH dehydrogenase [ubiquinone] 1 alpha subcomplex assembly factor 5
MSSDILIFDRQRLRTNRNRAAGRSDFLHEWTLKNIADRLTIIKRRFPLALMIGGTGLHHFRSSQIDSIITTDLSEKILNSIKTQKVQCDEEFLPFAGHSFDLALSALSLHTVNDLPGTLLQIRRALKPDGLFLAAMLGGETLFELRQILAETEMTVRNGISPRVFPFADKPQAGALLQRAGFNLPVIDSEIITVTYENIFKLMHDLRLMGEGNAILDRDKTFPGKSMFMEAARLYQEKFADPDGRIRATFEIIFMIGWAPHESQQKPLARGSAKHSMAEALNATEYPANEKTPA